MRRHLLVTNDFPPKVGGIQSYLWELWRRLPPDDVAVHTTPYAGADAFDADQAFTLSRSREPVLLPTRSVARRVGRLAAGHDAELVVWDPALPVGYAASRVDRPYAVVLHGAEVTVPGRLPVGRSLLARVLSGASLVICAGNYPAMEASRAADRDLPTVVVPPGVDTDRFRPLDAGERASVRTDLGLPVDAPLVVGVSRLVPRKGMDTLIRAAARLRRREPDLVVAIAGSGRDRRRLEQRFGFDYRFEAFVPAKKRVWGYYVLPILEADRFVGRLDPKLHRDRQSLEVKSLHWEPGVRETAARRRALEEALGVLARRVDAKTIDLPKRH